MARNGREGIGVVQSIHDRQIDARKFEAQETPAALEHAIGFLKGVFDARHVADAERDCVGVEARVGQRQRLGVAFDERQPLRESAPRRPLLPHAQHVAIDVDDRHLGQRAARLRHPEGDVAGPPGDVDMSERARRVTGGPWRRERPSKPGAGRTTSGRSSGHTDWRRYGRRRSPGSVFRPGERCVGRSAFDRPRRASGSPMKRLKP